MNPEFRKVALIAACLGLLVSLFVALRADGEAAGTTAAATTVIDVPSDAEPAVRKISVRRGRKVEIVVRTELSDDVHLHGYDLIADVGPGEPGRIEFTPNAAGIFELELEDRGLRIAELEVRP